jgi:quinol monooxygenase YgiN
VAPVWIPPLPELNGYCCACSRARRNIASSAAETKAESDGLSTALPQTKAQRKGEIVQSSNIPMIGPRDALTRRSAISVFGAIAAMASFSPLAITPSQSQQTEGNMTMEQYATNRKTLSEVVNGGGLLVVAQWEAKEGQADAVAAILRRFLPEAQNDPGAKLFLIGRGRYNPAQFLFYEFFVDEAALAAHLASGYFDTLITKEALPLLSKRERAQYFLL